MIRITNLEKRIFALVLMLSASHVSAISISSEPANHLGDESLYDNLLESVARDNELKDVANLLYKKKFDDAKITLAKFLGKYPKDPRGLELAGTILLQEGKELSASEESFKRALQAERHNARVWAKLGVVQLRQNETIGGEAALRKALEIDNNEPLALLYTGWSLDRRGQVIDAASYYEKLLTLKGSKGVSYIETRLAVIYNGQLRFKDTVKLLNAKLSKQDITKDNIEAFTELGLALAETGESNNAERIVKNLEALGAETQKIFLTGIILRAKQKNQEAINTFAKLKQHGDRNNLAAEYEIAKTYLRAGDYDNAAKHFVDATRQAPDAQKILVLKEATSIYLERKELDKALDVTRKAMRDASKNIPIAVHYAELNVLAKNNSEAKKSLEALNASNTTSAPPFYLVGKIYRVEKNFQKAEANFRQALKLDPTFIDAWVELAGVYHDQKQMAAAKDALKQGLEKNANDTTLAFELATLHDITDEADIANKFYESILKIEPGHVGSLNNLALNRLSENKTKEALELIQKAVAIEKNHPILLDTYAWVLTNNAQLNKALEIYGQIKGVMANDENFNYHYGVALYKTGKKSEAKIYLQKAVSSQALGEKIKTQIKEYLNNA